jgi:hypothetical protein
MEYWSNGIMDKTKEENTEPNTPLLHYSSTPFYQGNRIRETLGCWNNGAGMME